MAKSIPTHPTHRDLLYLPHSNLHTGRVSAIQMVEMCRAFSAQGVNVTLLDPIYLSDGGDSIQWDMQAHYGNLAELRFERLPTLMFEGAHEMSGITPLLRLPTYLPWMLMKRLRSRWTRRDVIFARCYLGFSVALAAAKSLPRHRRPRLVFEVHEEPSLARARLLRAADGLVVISESLAEVMTTNFGVPRWKIHVDHDGVDLDEFGASDTTQADARVRVALPTETSLAVYAGALHPAEVGVMLGAAKLLSNLGQLVVVGGRDPEVRRYRTAAEQTGAPASFVGFVAHERVPLYLNAADVLVMPYTGQLRWSKHFSPLKLFEYMASGRPIVATDLPVLHEILRDGGNAILVPPGDPGAMAAAISRLWANPHVARGLALQALSDVQNHSWNKRAARILEFMDAL